MIRTSFLLLLLCISVSAAAQKNYEKEWKMLDSLDQLNQTQTELSLVDRIYDETRVAGQGDQFLKAALYRLKLENLYREDFLPESILRTRMEISEAKEPVRQILYSVLGELYQRYYTNNRWKIQERSETMGISDDDISTWDLRKLVNASMQCYDQSLQNAGLLQQTTLSDFNAIMTGDKETRSLRPTLYDFLASRVLEFYLSPETGLTQPAVTFLMNKDAYFAPSQDFGSAVIATPDSLSFDFRALLLYQRLVAFHLNDPDPAALVDAELGRLSFVYDKSSSPRKDSLYPASLRELSSRYRLNPASAEIDFELATFLIRDEAVAEPFTDAGDGTKAVPENRKWNRKDAAALCEDAIKRFPLSYGAANCRALLEEIRQPQLSLTTCYAVLPAKPSLARIEFASIGRVWFRVVRTDVESENTAGWGQERLKHYLSLRTEKEWSQDLPDDGDYRMHSAEIRIPEMKPGFYIVLCSSNPAFPDSGALLTSCRLWVSHISYLSERNRDGSNRIQVLDRESGQPVKGVSVQKFTRDYDTKSRKMVSHAGEVYTTDRSGQILIPAGKEIWKSQQFYLIFKDKKDIFYTESYFSEFGVPDVAEKTYTRTSFFTDRSIYRPGQTICFKGIVLEKTGDKAAILSGFSTEVSLWDVNNQLISKQTLITNEFGSFSGTFTAPVGVLTGAMRLGNESGSTGIQVEEYKRPKFEVNFPAAKGNYRLGELIRSEGKAIAYAGSSVSGASVKYRVIRTAIFPYWCWNWRVQPESPEAEITSGTTLTADDGSFVIPFEAIPDPGVDPSTDPVFNFRVYADVTDLNGETHGSEVLIPVGYKALLLSTDIGDDFSSENGIRFSLTATNLSGEKQAADGSVTISRLKVPSEVQLERKWPRPDRNILSREAFKKDFPNEIYGNDDDISIAQTDAVVYSSRFNTSADSVISTGNSSLPAGKYLAEIRARDGFGQEVVYRKYFQTFLPASPDPDPVQPFSFRLLKSTAEPGETVSCLIGTPLEDARILVELSLEDSVFRSEVLQLSHEQRLFRIPVTEAYRGNFAIRVSMVRNNRAWLTGATVCVPFTNRRLDIRFSTFRDKLIPGQEEEWRITLSNAGEEKKAAEMLASMYDASLDAFAPHSWLFNLDRFYYGLRDWDAGRCFEAIASDMYFYPQPQFTTMNREYERLNWFGFDNYSFYAGRGGRMLKSERFAAAVTSMDESLEMESIAQDAPPPPPAPDEAGYMDKKDSLGVGYNTGELPELGSHPQVSIPGVVQTRKNLSETAFFFPQLSTNPEGEIIIRFKAPEALTRWKFMGLAYTKDLEYGQIEKTLITQKNLMIFANAPRFFREGDSIRFSAKLSNISQHDLQGHAELHFFDALTMKPADSLLGLTNPDLPVTIGPGQSVPLNWSIRIPEGLSALTYRITAITGEFSDGEEAAVPVLTDRMLVTESLPLPVRGMQEKTFRFDKLLNSAKGSSTLRNYRLTLEYTSYPAWYAVQALPYLIEYPNECAEQLFSRYYANTLATKIANSSPEIKRMFDNWRTLSPDALKSNLEKNETLKSVLIQESPWVREAASESEAKQRLALLFDMSRMAAEQASALQKLREMQAPSGGWPWFRGMPESSYITQYIMTGMGRMIALGALDLSQDPLSGEMLGKAVAFADRKMLEDFNLLRKQGQADFKNSHLNPDVIQYLYGRTYLLGEFPVPKEMADMMAFYRSQSERFWQNESNYMKGMIALYLNRLGDPGTASLIIRALKENSLSSDELGMYWKNEHPGWSWFQAPVETQAMLIEAFYEVKGDLPSVDAMKLWLLKQKQTQNWPTTRSTTEAIWALLSCGPSPLATGKLTEITLGSAKVEWSARDAADPEPGSGYFTRVWNGSEILPEMGKVNVKNPNPGPAWGSLYWQYFEKLEKITPAETPLKLSKKLFVERNTPTGPAIEPVSANTPVKVGDKIVVRVELRCDRDMEYIHLKDMRASAFEPVNVISGYRYQNGLGYYESSRDAASDFFISYLPKGTWVFEYRLTATQQGDFSNGVTSVECMYAPEFSAHSEGVRVKVE
jgi:hypothetical protein